MTHETPALTHTVQRSLRLRKAISTSVSAKLASVLLQVFSLPVAASSLGSEGFALYSMMVAILSWLTLSNLGIAPAATVRLSRELAENQMEEAVATFSTALTITIAGAGCVAAAMLAISELTPAPQVLFHKYDTLQPQVVLCLVCVTLIFLISTSLSIVESAQLAAQDRHKLNLWTGVGTAAAAACVFLAARYMASPSAILIAASGPVILCRILNAANFLSRNSLHWRPPCHADFQVAASLVRQGVHFSTAGPMNNFLSHLLPVLVVGYYGAAQYAAGFAAVMNAVIICSSFFAITSAPLLGALPEAQVRGDRAWIARTYKRLLIVNGVYSICIFLTFHYVGTLLFAVWYRQAVAPSADLLTAAGIYFVLLSLEVTNYAFLSGLSQIKHASYYLSAKSILYALLLVGMASDTMHVMPFALLIATNALLSAAPLSAKVSPFVRGEA